MPSEAWLRTVDRLVAEAIGDVPEGYIYDESRGAWVGRDSYGSLAVKFVPRYHASSDLAHEAAQKMCDEHRYTLTLDCYHTGATVRHTAGGRTDEHTERCHAQLHTAHESWDGWGDTPLAICLAIVRASGRKVEAE